MFKLKIQLHGGVTSWLMDDVLGFDGFGSGGSNTTIEPVKSTVAPSVVSSKDTSAEAGASSTAKARRKKGFASTMANRSTIMGSAGSSEDSRTTLG